MPIPGEVALGPYEQLDRRAYIDRKPDPPTEWRTPLELLRWATLRFGPFDLDPAANCGRHGTGPANYLCERYYCLDCGDDGLLRSWESRRVFLNPPYDKSLKDWVHKASLREAYVAAVLLPVRTGRSWWCEYVDTADHLIFLPGRLTFGGAENSAPFDSALAIYWKGGSWRE